MNRGRTECALIFHSPTGDIIHADTVEIEPRSCFGLSCEDQPFCVTPFLGQIWPLDHGCYYCSIAVITVLTAIPFSIIAIFLFVSIACGIVTLVWCMLLQYSTAIFMAAV